ncbi:GSCOCG00006820001-RA-CDS [Cotesia congregata]|nr:GSCOCG00006820001-RA-CDS [Cotesia congregata]
MYGPLLMNALKRYVPIVTLPFAGIIGFIGYNLEGWLSDKYTPSTEPVIDQRTERLLKNIDSDGVQSAKVKHNPLDVNLSPSLSNVNSH